jgi:pimeloyl-ACP methyl ester carboxylesterase
MRRSDRTGPTLLPPALILLLLISLFILWEQPLVGQSPAGVFESSPCMFEMPLLGFLPPENFGYECGYVTVPARHADSAGPKIKLPVAILPAESSNPRPDPLFLAQGGPGGDAFQVFALTAPEMTARQDRDIVIFNQRGTLYAEPSLVCTEVFDVLDQTLSLPPDKANEVQRGAYTQCRQRLQAENISLADFNSLENAADVDAIRAALGYDQINFYGVSYGTLLGLHLMRDFPDGVRTIILDSVVPTQLNYVPLIPQSKERILAEMFAACSNNSECNGVYPNLEERFTALVEKLNEQPVSIPVMDPDSNERVQLYVDGATFIDMLFSAFYLPEMFAVFPKLVIDMEAGRYDFWQLTWPLLVFDRTFSEGMFFSVLCAEDGDFDPTNIPLDGVRAQIAQTAADDLQFYKDTCALWQVPPLPALVDKPVVSNIPTLLLAGQFDPITPPSYAAEAARTLSNGYLVTSPVASHGVAFSNGCTDRIMQDFLDDPTVAPTTDCIVQYSVDGFVAPDSRVVGLIGRLLNFDLPSVTLTVLAGIFLAGVLSSYMVWPLVFLVRWLRNSWPSATTTAQRWVGWASKGVVLLFGGLAVVFVAGLGFFVVMAFSSTPMLILSAVSGSATLLFVIPWLLFILAIVIVALLVLVWLTRVGSVWGRLYYTVLTLCVVSYVLMLYMTDMMNVLL